MSVLSENLRLLRGSQSQTDFAIALGMKYQQYARYEKGENTPSADIIANICRHHNVSSDWLLGLNTNNRPVNTPSNIIESNKSVGLGNLAICGKCPYRKKLKKIEVLLK